MMLLGPTDEVVHCGFQNGLWTELSVPEFPIFTPRCKIQLWTTVGQSDRPPADQMVKTPAPSLFSLSHNFLSSAAENCKLHL